MNQCASVMCYSVNKDVFNDTGIIYQTFDNMLFLLVCRPIHFMDTIYIW